MNFERSRSSRLTQLSIVSTVVCGINTKTDLQVAFEILLLIRRYVKAYNQHITSMSIIFLSFFPISV